MDDVTPADLRRVCEGMRDSVFVVGPDRRVTFANDRLLAASGLEREAVVGEPVDVLAALAREGFDEFAAALESMLTGEDHGERRVEAVVAPGAGARMTVELRLSPLSDGAVLVVMRDVTERKRREAEVDRRSEQLAVLNRLLRHDIRNDASVVVGWSEELADRLDDPAHQEAVENIGDAARHIVELTREARDVQSVIDEEGTMEHAPVALDRVLDQEVQKAREMHPEATIDLSGDLPSATVAANELLGSVFANLLTNAVVHNDGDEPRVAVRVDRADDAVTVVVADDGPGIPTERRADLFDRGERSLEGTGHGMGLYIVDALVDEFDGSVAVDDDDALGGARFTVRLPLAE